MEKENALKLSASGCQPQTDALKTVENDVVEKLSRLPFENLRQLFLSSFRSENKKDQIHCLLAIYVQTRHCRRRTGGQPIRRNQFLESAQCFVESEGLVFGKHLQNIRFDRLQCN